MRISFFRFAAQFFHKTIRIKLKFDDEFQGILRNFKLIIYFTSNDVREKKSFLNKEKLLKLKNFQLYFKFIWTNLKLPI